MGHEPVLNILRNATDKKLSGELAVQTGDSIARVFMVEGCIAWAVAGKTEHLGHALDRDGVVAIAEYTRVVHACQLSGGNVCEMLVTEGLVGREMMRHHLRLHIARNLAEITKQDNAPAVFRARARAYASELTFDLDELLRIMRITEALPQLLSEEAALASAASIEGMRAVCIVDRQNGALVNQIGTACAELEQFAGDELAMFEAQQQLALDLGFTERVEELVTTTTRNYRILVPLDAEARHVLLCLLDREGNLGLARLVLAEVSQTTRVAHKQRARPLAAVS